MELREQGLTGRQIQEKFGFSKKQYENFITRYNRRQDKIAAGIALKRKGRPPKDYIVSEQDKVAELKYILARKDAKIKSLEMENEIMRDFSRSQKGSENKCKIHGYISPQRKIFNK